MQNRKIKTYSQFVFEKAIPFEDILKDDTQQGLVVKDSKAPGGGILRNIVLYDFDDKKVLAFAQIREWDGIWEINMTVAEKDYGPDLYDLALMSAYPEPIIPSKTIKPAAQRVWTYYKEKRNDVKKVPIPEDHSEYKKRYETSVNGKEAYSKDPDMLNVINTMYSLEQSDVFDKLIKRGEEYLIKYHVDKNKIIHDADRVFWKRYDLSTD
jgi:hypothetical protein